MSTCIHDIQTLPTGRRVPMVCDIPTWEALCLDGIRKPCAGSRSKGSRAPPKFSDNASQVAKTT
eukprot:3096226-Amphidinium_carterae.1